MKEKLQLEYVFNNVSLNILWGSISTPNGLGEWFADKVDADKEHYTFYWNKVGQSATLVQTRNGVYVRFHWDDDDDPKSYFEFRVTCNELTKDVVLTITETVEPEDLQEQTDLWNEQVKLLRKAYGL